VEAYRACMINPETADQVKKTIEEGHALTITATPTTFVNGRRLVGPDRTALEQYLTFNPATE